MNYTTPRPTRGCQDLLKSASKPSVSDPRVAAPIQVLWDSLPQKCKIVVASFLGVLSGIAAQAADWTTYQHDVRRSGVTAEKIDGKALQMAWHWHSPSPPQPAWAGPAKWDAWA